MSKEKLLSVKNLKTHFTVGNSIVKAVDGISFDLEPGKTFAIVGESGSGKSITALSCLLYTSPSPRDGLLSRMPSSA